MAGDEANVRDRLEEILGDRSPREVALVAGMVSGFEAKAAGLLQRALAAVAPPDSPDSPDPAAAVLQVHSLRGSALNLGSVRLAALCEDLEEQVAAGRVEQLIAGRQQLDDELSAFVRVLGAVRLSLEI
jgi:HPt (histidine-containing phosphotransfer) domain-containing protein